MTLEEILKEHLLKREQCKQHRTVWFQSILIAGSTTLGALVALSNNHTERMCVRFAFVLTTGLLALGILSAAIALYYDSACSKRAILAIREQLHNMMKGFYTAAVVFAEDAKTFLLFDVLTYIFLSLSFISLMGYVVLKNLPELFNSLN